MKPKPTRLGAMIRLHRTVTDASLRDSATSIGISAATMMRIEHGYTMDTATFMKLLHWLLAPQESKP